MEVELVGLPLQSLHMKISYSKPPIYDKAKAAFQFKEPGTIFTYGDTIYNPGGVPLTPDLITHEEVHERQQKAIGAFGARRWWKRYLKDPQFRFEQELEAYRAQYKFVKGFIKDRNTLAAYLNEIAGFLSGPMYGNIISRSDAAQRIKE